MYSVHGKICSLLKLHFRRDLFGDDWRNVSWRESKHRWRSQIEQTNHQSKWFLFCFFFFKASATFTGRLSFLNMQIEGRMTDEQLSRLCRVRFLSRRCGDTSSRVIFTLIQNRGGVLGWQSGAVASLFHVRQLNPKDLVKVGEWVLLSRTVS